MPAGKRAGARGRRCSVLDRAGRGRQVDREARAAGSGVAHLDATAALRDDPVHGREAEARADAVLLRREERLEDVRQDVVGDARCPSSVTESAT